MKLLTHKNLHGVIAFSKNRHAMKKIIIAAILKQVNYSPLPHHTYGQVLGQAVCTNLVSVPAIISTFH